MSITCFASYHYSPPSLLSINRAHRFDANGDGRVDLLNFLNFFLTRDRKEHRSAARVNRAFEAIRDDALHKQVDKVKKQTIDHIDRCFRVHEKFLC